MPSSGQISQLVLQVDANVAVAQRSLQELARTVQQSTGQMNSALGSNDNAINQTLSQHHKLGLAFNNARIAQTELTAAVTRSVDAYGAGASPVRILMTEMGRLSEAAMFLGGGAGNGVLGTVMRFVGGPWGIAMLVGGTILAKLIMGHKQEADSLDTVYGKLVKSKEQTALNAQADDIWAHSLDGLIDRSEKLNAQLEHRLETQTDLGKKTLAQAQNDFAAAMSAAAKIENDPKSTQAQIDKAQKAIHDTSIALHNAQVLAGQDAGEAIASITQSAKVWADQQLHAMQVLQTAHPELAEKGAADGMLAAFYQLKTAIDDAASANVNFSGTVSATNRLNNELATGAISVSTYDQKMRALAQSLHAAAEAAKDAKKGTGEFGKQIGFGGAESIARSAGLTVTSGYRSEAKQAELYRTVRTPENPVARAGTSAHEGVNGKWALDIAFAPGLTPEKLRKIYGDQGVSLSAVYKESGHFHIEGSRSQAAAAEKAAAAAAQKARVGDDTFARQAAQLDAEMLQVRKQLVGDYDTQAALAEQEIDSQKQAQLAAIEKEVDEKQISGAQAQILRAKVQQLAAEKQVVIEQQRIVRALEADQATMDQRFGFALDDLKFADDMATTQADRRKIELQILDIQYEQKLVDLQILKAKQEQLGDITGAALTQGQINNLGNEKGQDRQRVLNGTLDPLQAWAKQVPQTAAEINQALQSIEVQGLDNLASGIADVVNGTKTLGQVFKDISTQIVGDIIQMTIKMLIFRAISSILGGGSIPSPDLSMPASVNLSTSSLVPSVGLRAAGGPVSAGAPYLVGEKGPELFVPSASGTIIPNASRIPASAAANSNGPTVVEVRLVDDLLEARIVQGAGKVVAKVAPAIVTTATKAAVSGIARSQSRPKLMGR